ncbi:hypothetical protein [Paraburkholderia sp.]|uniref:hypothetical protein n=1 Tax=Paraburkholderia sp. TaxID=1926495 RepID=UPI0025F60A00|nr:hypothetical protein [Paraburkholderia sp.]
MSNEAFLTAGTDAADNRIEHEIEWAALDCERKTCLSCGAQQHDDGSIPCGH